MKKLRISDDYIAVDDVDEGGSIKATPIYLRRGKPEMLLWLDREEETWRRASVLYEGGSELKCVDVNDGLDWYSDLTELLTEAKSL